MSRMTGTAASSQADPDHLVYVVEDEAPTREALCDLLQSTGLNVQAFASAREFLNHARSDLPQCILLDIGLPDISGLELQSQFADGDHPPIVFLTGCGDIPTSVSAMKKGAVDFLTKPVRDGELIAAIGTALERDRRQRAQFNELHELEARMKSLTQRELEVMRLVIGGLMNKQAAAYLGVQEVTLQVHRSRMMQKMGAASVAELVRMTERLGVDPAATRRSPGPRDQ